MSLIPAFEPGLWSAWILFIPIVFIYLFAVRVTSARESEKSGDFQLTKNEPFVSYAPLLVMFIAFFYAIFLPLQLGTIWLLTGFSVYLFGVIFTLTAILNFATSPEDQVITQGVYGISRNPMFLGMILMQTGLGIACLSWLYLLLVLTLIVVLNVIMSSEERYLRYRYGDEYLNYKNRTPKWIGMPKSEKK
jgi:protein-S-isoprenylcysteine O-methyltransferase Ste14